MEPRNDYAFHIYIHLASTSCANVTCASYENCTVTQEGMAVCVCSEGYVYNPNTEVCESKSVEKEEGRERERGREVL